MVETWTWMARLGEAGAGAPLCPPPASPVPAPTQFPAGGGAWQGGSAPCQCSPSQGKDGVPCLAWPSCPLGSHGATAGGLHPEEDGVTAMAGGPFGYFCYIPYSSSYLDKGAGSFQGQNSQNPAGDHESTMGCLLANCSFWGFNAKPCPCIWRSWREFFDFKGFLTGLC